MHSFRSFQPSRGSDVLARAQADPSTSLEAGEAGGLVGNLLGASRVMPSGTPPMNGFRRAGVMPDPRPPLRRVGVAWRSRPGSTGHRFGQRGNQRLEADLRRPAEQSQAEGHGSGFRVVVERRTDR